MGVGGRGPVAIGNCATDEMNNFSTLIQSGTLQHPLWVLHPGHSYLQEPTYLPVCEWTSQRKSMVVQTINPIQTLQQEVKIVEGEVVAPSETK